MRELRIQVDNLCQFLPQEKVAEFAGLGPIDLLDRTMQAIAPVETIDQQKELKELYKQQKESQRQVEDGTEQLHNLEARQQALQADVDKLREREEVQEKIQEYESAILVARYAKARETYLQAKTEKKQTEKALARLQRDSAPSFDVVNRKQEYKHRIGDAIRAKEQALRATEMATDAILKDIEDAEGKLRKIATEEEVEERQMTEKKKDLSLHVQKLTNLRAQYAQGSNSFDAAEWNRKIVRIFPLPYYMTAVSDQL